MGITDLFRRTTLPASPASHRTDDVPGTPRGQPARRVGGQTRTEIRTNRRARIRDLREKVELVNLKRVLAYQRACNKADRNGLARPAYPELLTTETIRNPAPVPPTDRGTRDGSLMPAVAAVLATGVARMVTDAADRTANRAANRAADRSPAHGRSPAANPGTDARRD